MAKRTIQTCRFYADIPQYLKSLGYYEGSNAPDVWDMNPVNVQEYNSPLEFNISKPSIELDQLLTNIPQSTSSGMYGAVFAHNLTDTIYGFDINTSSITDTQEIINYNSSTSEYNGYSFWNIDVLQESDVNKISLAFLGQKKVGAVSFGRWFEPSHSPDLQVKLITEFDGITNQSTVGGNTITNINHLGQPHWGDLPAWTLEKQDGHDYKIGANTQRRTWQVKFSYMADNDVFNKANNPNKFFTVTDGNYVFDTSMASFFGLTLNGNLRFWFCPNSAGSNTLDENQSQIQEGEKDLEFALCQIDQDSLTFNQVAHRTFDVSMNIREVW
tara:strand:- start:1259 stop:2242 length:984 start_codon:yes stop_codon:yes gene_type:complete